MFGPIGRQSKKVKYICAINDDGKHIASLVSGLAESAGCSVAMKGPFSKVMRRSDRVSDPFDISPIYEC